VIAQNNKKASGSPGYWWRLSLLIERYEGVVVLAGECVCKLFECVDEHVYWSKCLHEHVRANVGIHECVCLC